jgi:hypothetical protein
VALAYRDQTERASSEVSERSSRAGGLVEPFSDLVDGGSGLEILEHADTGIRVSLNTHAPLSLPCRVLFFSRYPYQNCPAGDVVLDTAALQTKGVYDVYRTSPGQ